jgi:hypothetical protein
MNIISPAMPTWYIFPEGGRGGGGFLVTLLVRTGLPFIYMENIGCILYCLSPIFII